MSNAVPEGWRSSQLKDFVDVRSSNVDKKSYEGHAPVRLCNYTDVYYNNQITSKINFMEATAKEREIERFTLEYDDVIITKDSETPYDIAIPAHVSEKLSNVLCGYHLTLLRPDKDQASGQYLSHLFQLPSIQHHFYILANGITRFGLTADAINNAPLVTPPLPEQQKIAAILSSVDDVIEKTQAQIDKLKDLKTGMMQELLTKGVCDENGKRHTEFKDSPVGRIPVGWDVVSFFEAVTIQNGQVDPKEDRFKNLVLIAPNHVESNTGRLLEKETASEQGAISGKFLCSPNTIIYSKIRPKLRKAVMVDFECLCSADMYPLECKDSLLPDFLKYLILDQRFSIFAATVSERSNIPKINRTEIGEFSIALPSIEEQKLIGDMIRSVDQKFQKVAVKIDGLKRMKKALMQDLLTGTVRVKVD